MSMYAYINGKYISSKRAMISLDDVGFLFGDGLFETLRSYKDRIFTFDRHLERLFSSMYQLKYNPQFDSDFIKHRTEDLLKKTGMATEDAYIKIIVTRSPYLQKFKFNFLGKPNLIITVKKFTPYPQQYYSTGIKIINSSIKRNPLGNELYRHKLLNYFENVYAKNEAYSEGAHEAFFTARDRSVLECASSNIFTVKNSKVYTTPLTFNILPGVTRKIVIDICKDMKLKFCERKLHYYNLVEADEIFITSSLMEIMPVGQIDEHKIDSCKVPGPITGLISKEYKKLVLQS